MEGSVLGKEWGALSGFTPEEALGMVTNMHSELHAENTRLRGELDGNRQVPPKVESEPPPEPQPGPNWDVIRGEDTKAAEDELKRWTGGVVDELYDKRSAADKARSFPTDRERAKRDAALQIEKAGGNFAEYEAALDKAMTEQYSVAPQQQTDPMMWVQAYTFLKGQEAMRGKPTEGHVERPTPYGAPSAGAASETYDDPNEAHAHKMWETELGTKIPGEEWKAFRDDIDNVVDYENWLEEQQRKRSRR